MWFSLLCPLCDTLTGHHYFTRQAAVFCLVSHDVEGTNVWSKTDTSLENIVNIRQEGVLTQIGKKNTQKRVLSQKIGLQKNDRNQKNEWQMRKAYNYVNEGRRI